MSIFISQFVCTAPWVAVMTNAGAEFSAPGPVDAPEPEIGAALEIPPPLPLAADGGDAWMHRGDMTDIGVGGDGETFYLIDGDTSLTIG